MPDLELALLRLPKPIDSMPATLKATLQSARVAVESLTTVTPRVQMRYYAQVEDPCLLYIVASWPSARIHHEAWIPTPENQAGMKALTDREGVRIESFVHLGGLSMKDLPGDEAAVVRLGRCLVHAEKKAAFERTWKENVCSVEEASSRPGKVPGGWIVEEKEGEAACWMMFSGWGSVDHHHAFGASEGSKDLFKIRDLMADGEVKHLTRLDL